MRGSRRAGLQSGVDDLFNLVRVVNWFAPASPCYLPQTVDTFLSKTLSPQGDSLIIYIQIDGDELILPALCGGQNNAAAQCHLLRRAMGRHPLFKFGLVAWAQLNRCGLTRHEEKIPFPPNNTIYL